MEEDSTSRSYSTQMQSVFVFLYSVTQVVNVPAETDVYSVCSKKNMVLYSVEILFVWSGNNVWCHILQIRSNYINLFWHVVSDVNM